MVRCRPFVLGTWLAAFAAVVPACGSFRGDEGAADAGSEAAAVDGATPDGAGLPDGLPSGSSTRPSLCAACTAAQVCCLGDVQTTCAMQASDCPKIAVACGSPADCPTAGDKCCLTRVGAAQGSTACKNSCASGEQALCVGMGDCTAPAMCLDATNVPRLLGLKSCQ